MAEARGRGGQSVTPNRTPLEPECLVHAACGPWDCLGPATPSFSRGLACVMGRPSPRCIWKRVARLLSQSGRTRGPRLTLTGPGEASTVGSMHSEPTSNPRGRSNTDLPLSERIPAGSWQRSQAPVTKVGHSHRPERGDRGAPQLSCSPHTTSLGADVVRSWLPCPHQWGGSARLSA